MEAERAGGGFALQALGDAGRIVRTFPFMRRLFSGGAAQVRAEARRFPFVRLRRDPDVTPFRFALEVGRVNRMNHLRSLRRDTQRLRERLEALHVDAGPPVKQTGPPASPSAAGRSSAPVDRERPSTASPHRGALAAS